MREELAREHRELDALAQDMIACVEREVPDLDQLARLKWSLSRQLATHLIKEDRLVYPRLEAGSNRTASELARRFAREMGGLADAFRAYVSDWPLERVQREWPAFRDETLAIMAILRTRIAREENELYPLMASNENQTGT